MTEPAVPETPFDLTQSLEVLLRRRWIVAAVAAAVIAGTAATTFLTQPLFEASTLLVIEKERGGGQMPANSAMIENSNDDYYQTQYRLLQSLSLMEKVYSDLKLGSHEDFAEPRGIEKLQRAVTIAPVVRSRLVYVSVRSHDPLLAAKISTSIGETFVEQNLSNQLFISKEVLQALQLRPGTADARRTYEALPSVVSNPLIQQLKAEYAKLESQAAEMSQKFTPKYPAMMSVRSSMEALKRQIDTETDKIVQSLKTELSGQLKGNNVRIVDTARVPKRPIKPRKLASMLLGLVGGLSLGLLVAFLVEVLDQSVRTQEDVENKLRLPFLGLIPESAQRGGSVYDSLLAKELSLTSEAFRNLRTMVDFAAVGQQQATLVTSTVQSEGKTYVAANLAVVFAQLGESVLLIDGDLRRPQVHKVFEVNSQRGLSDFLATGNSVEDLPGLIQPSEIPNLKILPCGPRPPNPSELLNTPRLGALVAWGKKNFDRVIVDCTPMFPINDTILWGRHVAPVVFIVRYGATRVPLSRNACQKIETGGMKILGVAINAAKASSLAYTQYGYYYEQYYRTYHEGSHAKS